MDDEQLELGAQQAKLSGLAGGELASRKDVLLSGTPPGELVASFLAWASGEVGASGVQLWQDDGSGSNSGWRCLAFAGCAPDEDDSQVAGSSDGEEPCVSGNGRLALPLHVPGAGRVALVVAGCTPGPEPVRRLQQAAQILERRLPTSLEFERARTAEGRLREAERLQQALFAVADLAASTRELSDILGSLHGIVGTLMYAENFFVALRERGGNEIRFPYFRDTEDAEPPDPEKAFGPEVMKDSLTAHVMATGAALMGPSERLVEEAGLEMGGHGPQSVDWLGVPLLAAGECFGAVVVQSYDPRYRYQERDRSLLNFVAQHIAGILQQRWIQSELERRVQQRTNELREANRALMIEVDERQRGEQLQAALFRITELGSEPVSLEEFYAALHRIIGRLLYAKNFYIAMLSADGDALEFPYSADERDVQIGARKLGRGLTEYVLRTGQALLADRNAIDDLNEAGEIHSVGARATMWLGVPLMCESGTAGVIAVQSYDSEHGYQRRDQEILTFVSLHIANALDRKHAGERLRQANAELERRVAERTEALYSANRDLREQILERQRFERQLQYAATHDALTGLPNRVTFLDALAESLLLFRRQPDRRFGVLFLDLDRFKVINDSVGHLVGDELLKEVGKRLTEVVTGKGMVARLGGDEFAVLVRQIGRDEDVVELASQIIAVLDEPIRAGGKELFTAASVGIASARAQYVSPGELLRDADVALYRAKARGRRRYEVFDDALRREALQQMEVEGNLRRALARSEFEPVFQPIIALATGRVAGYEALMRWRHPQRGLLGPGEFLSTAEETGVAEAMDWQIFEAVAEHAGQLTRDGSYVTLNVGGRHFRNPRFVTDFLRLLDRFDFPPQSLQVEVTEHILIEEPEKVRVMMDELRASGIRLALDDFGTGYSSLSYLHRFPLNTLKIDRSFVVALDQDDSPNAHAVMHAICSLGNALGMSVIAEGIETRQQMNLVRQFGCGYGQGYLFSRPLSLQALLEERAMAALR